MRKINLRNINFKDKKQVTYLIIVLIIAVIGMFTDGEKQDENKKDSQWYDTEYQSDYEYEGDELAIHYIDVGNADCVYLQYNENTMVIDTGISDAWEDIEEYLTEQGLEQINTMILTHPDSDHIGTARKMLQHFDVNGTIYMTDFEKDTSTYTKLMKYVNKYDYDVVYPEAGDDFEFGPCTVEFLGPVEENDDSNSMSLVCRLTYEDTSFLFTGDCTEEEEESILENVSAAKLRADVLKVGHHGSSSSSTSRFLKAVDADYGIISCAIDNDYGHPHDEVLERLEDADVEVYRTDINGNIVATSDGENIRFTIEKEGK